MELSAFNTDKYTISALLWNGTGYFFWFIAYVLLVRNSIKKQFVEMPFFIVAGNLAWEFVWSFIYQTDLGSFYADGVKVCFFLDLFIFFMVLKYGSKQIVDIPFIKKHFVLIMLLLAIMWFLLNYFFVKQGFDTSIGANSGYILNLFISFLCPLLYFRSTANNFSIAFTLSRFIGTACTSVAKFIIYPENQFILTIGVCCFILDFAFTIYLINHRTKQSII